MVRTHLEYVSSVWTPFKINHIESKEKAKRRVTRQLQGYAKLTYQERPKRFELPTQSYRRLRGDLIKMYKIRNGVYDFVVGDIVESWDERQEATPKDKQNESKNGKEKERIQDSSCRSGEQPSGKCCQCTIAERFQNMFDRLMEEQEVKYDNYRVEVSITLDHGSDV